MSRMAKRESQLEETPEWIVVVPLTQRFFLSTEQRDRLHEATTAGKPLNCKALTCVDDGR